MTKISKLILGAGALGVLGITALPIAGYADVNTLLTVAVDPKSDTSGATGGNDDDGYIWYVKDTDATNLHMGTADATGALNGGIAPATTSGQYGTASAVAHYGVKFTPTASATEAPTSGVAVASTSYIAITGSKQKIGETSDAGSIQTWPTALGITAGSDPWGTDTQGGSPVSLTAQWSSALPAGTYQNTITISQEAK